MYYLLNIGPGSDETRNHKVSIKILINFNRRPFEVTIVSYVNFMITFDRLDKFIT